jgi:hypothetical protein
MTYSQNFSASNQSRHVKITQREAAFLQHQHLKDFERDMFQEYGHVWQFKMSREQLAEHTDRYNNVDWTNL